MLEDLPREEDAAGDHDLDGVVVGLRGGKEVVVVHGCLRARTGQLQHEADLLYEAQRREQGLEVRLRGLLLHGKYQ
jgi:hypothetical protein